MNARRWPNLVLESWPVGPPLCRTFFSSLVILVGVAVFGALAQRKANSSFDSSFVRPFSRPEIRTGIPSLLLQWVIYTSTIDFSEVPWDYSFALRAPHHSLSRAILARNNQSYEGKPLQKTRPNFWREDAIQDAEVRHWWRFVLYVGEISLIELCE